MIDEHIWWYVTRSSAMIAWVLMTLSVVWGILLSTRIFRRLDNPGWLQDLHKYLSGASLIMVGLHLVSLMLDGYFHATVAELLVPFVIEYRPLASALGILAFYLMIAVQGTSLLMNRLPRTAWRMIHYTSYASLIMVAVHSIYSGTDAGSTWFAIVSIVLIAIAAVATVVRLVVLLRARRARPAPVAAPDRLTPSLELPRRMMTVIAQAVRADGVLGVRMAAVDGGPLPPWHPGSHITLVLPNGLQRQYSLCGDPAERGYFEIAVLRTIDSKGGSAFVHEQFRVGMILEVDGPLNHFELQPAAEYLFIAGGIGITPITSMIASLPAGRRWRLVYFGRSRTTMAFLPELAARYPEQVVVVAADERITLPDFSELARLTADVYCCGPESLRAAVAEHVAPERMHFERFVPLVRMAREAVARVEVTASRSRKTFEVVAGTTILEGLEDNGVPILGSCRKGVCGTCEVRVTVGAVEHLDSVMEDAEKDALGIMYPCVSRSTTSALVLDI